MGLKALKDLHARKINIYGDSEMVVKKFQRSYQAKHPRLRSYRNLVLDLLEDLKEYHFTVIPRKENVASFTIIPRKENVAADALVVSASVFQLPMYPNKKYKIEVRHKPAILDNVDHWQVFEDEK